MSEAGLGQHQCRSFKETFKKCGISHHLDGTEDDAFQYSDNDESENKCEGFTAEDILVAEEYNQNIASQITSLTELSDGEVDRDYESSSDDEH